MALTGGVMVSRCTLLPKATELCTFEMYTFYTFYTAKR